jgi:beta-glucosidase
MTNLTKEAVKTRVDALLGRMSLDEKIGQLTQVWGLDLMQGPKPEELARKGLVGSLLYVLDTKRINAIQKIAVEESPLGIPILFGLDVMHGFNTVFPISLAMASSWDPTVIERAQTVAAREARAFGIQWTFYPMVDICRDPRWGRILESAGEDPFLGSAMAAAHVRGFQGTTLGDPDHLAACAKHFAGYGAPDGGRDYDPVYLSEAQLRNDILPPFQAAIKAGVATLMSAYMDLNNVPATGNRFLLRQVLRDEWGFDGFVVSDASAIASLVTHGFAKDGRDAAYRAISAGVNMDMGSTTYMQHLAGLVQDGTLKMAELDEAVRPILELKIRMGLFEHPYAEEGKVEQVTADPAHRQEARLVAQRSMVLLKNEGGLLPLSKSVKNLAVIGPLADSKEAVEGMAGLRNQPAAVTVLEGIRLKLPEAMIGFAPGPKLKKDIPSMMDEMAPMLFPWKQKEVEQTPEEAEAAFQEALATAGKADMVVMVLGEAENMSGESASRASLDLPGRQEELLKAVVALGKPVVLVLLNGRPLSFVWAAENVPAILEAWQAGWEGGNAIADILFGDVNPGGKLPVTFPRKASHAPTYYARTLTHSPENTPMYRSRYWDGPTAPLFPFGFGLSYSTFSFSNLQVGAMQVKVGQTVEVKVDVTNTSSITGDEVAQLYIHQRFGSDSRPMRQLKGFERITLKPGETKTVTFKLGPDELTYWSTSLGKWIQETADFDVWVGADSQADLHTEFSVVDVVQKIAAPAPVSPKVAAISGKFNDKTKLGAILEDKKALALLKKYAPDLESNPMLKMAKGMTIETMKGFLNDEQKKQFDDLIDELNKS